MSAVRLRTVAPVKTRGQTTPALVITGRLSENEKFLARSRKAKILTTGIH